MSAKSSLPPPLPQNHNAANHPCPARRTEFRQPSHVHLPKHAYCSVHTTHSVTPPCQTRLASPSSQPAHTTLFNPPTHLTLLLFFSPSIAHLQLSCCIRPQFSQKFYDTRVFTPFSLTSATPPPYTAFHFAKTSCRRLCLSQVYWCL